MNNLQLNENQTCSRSLNLNFFENKVENLAHIKNCSVCLKRFKSFKRDIYRFKDFQIDIELTNQEKQLIIKMICIKYFTSILHKLRGLSSSFSFLGDILKDLAGVVFSIKTALFCIGVMFISLFFKLIF